MVYTKNKKLVIFFLFIHNSYTRYLEKHQMNDINNSMPTKGWWLLVYKIQQKSLQEKENKIGSIKYWPAHYLFVMLHIYRILSIICRQISTEFLFLTSFEYFMHVWGLILYKIDFWVKWPWILNIVNISKLPTF